MQQDKGQTVNASSPPPQISLSPESLEKLIEIQLVKAQTEKDMLMLRHKELEINSRLGEQSLSHQSEFLKRQPGQHRKTIAVYGGITLGILLLFFAFLTYCLSSNNTAFAKDFLQIASYFFISIVSFWFGRKSKSEKKEGEPQIEDAQIVDDK